MTIEDQPNEEQSNEEPRIAEQRVAEPIAKPIEEESLSTRKVWTVTDVTDVFGPSAILRSYLEQGEVRRYLQRVAAAAAGRRAGTRVGGSESDIARGAGASDTARAAAAAGTSVDIRRPEPDSGPPPLACAVDVGCGYGRLTPVLGEFASRVIGCEREASLLAIARPLQPAVTFIETSSLAALPVEDARADFALAFTVLQHMPDAQAEAVLGEIRRIVTPAGHVLLVEETDPSLVAGDAAHADHGYTRGRPVEWYAARLRDFTLLETSPRRIEPGYPRPDVGTYMLFGRGV